MSHQTKHIHKIDVGTPSPEFQQQDSQEWEAIAVRFHNFENFPAARDNAVESPEFTGFGHQWKMRLYPGGSMPNSDDGNVALYLCNRSDEPITICCSFSMKAKGWKTKRDFALKDARKFDPLGSRGNVSWGTPNFATRTAIISALVEGTLVIEVWLWQPDRTGSTPMPIIPENPLSKTILEKFNDEESADIAFEVGGEEDSPATFYAHRLILEGCVPVAAPGKSGEDSTTIPIPDVKREIFRHLLYYSYGGKVSEDDLKDNAKDIIEAADKYEIVGLKLEAEATLVTSTVITIDNVMELILFADQKNCALLKEAAMDFIVKNKADVVKEVSFDNFPGHLTKDVLVADTMDDNERVSALRKRLQEKGLDIDGSREALIARLEENS